MCRSRAGRIRRATSLLGRHTVIIIFRVRSGRSRAFKICNKDLATWLTSPSFSSLTSVYVEPSFAAGNVAPGVITWHVCGGHDGLCVLRLDIQRLVRHDGVLLRVVRRMRSVGWRRRRRRRHVRVRRARLIVGSAVRVVVLPHAVLRAWRMARRRRYHGVGRVGRAEAGRRRRDVHDVAHLLLAGGRGPHWRRRRRMVLPRGIVARDMSLAARIHAELSRLRARTAAAWISK